MKNRNVGRDALGTPKSKTDKVMQKPREMIAGVVAKDTDPNGSYTGAPVNRNEKPVQDADDL